MPDHEPTVTENDPGSEAHLGQGYRPTATDPAAESLGSSNQPAGAETSSWFSSGKNKVVASGSAAAVAAVVAGLAFAMSGGEEAPEPKAEPSASAPAVPGETQAPSIEPGVGVVGTTFETANTSKAREFVQEAMKPVLTSDYTPEEAVVRFGQLYNIYYTSGTIDPATQGNLESTSSVEEGDKILDNMFGGTINVSDFTKERRGLIADGLYYLNDIQAAPEGKTGTYHHSFKVDSENGDGTFSVTETVETNFNELEDNYFTDNEGGAVTHETHRIITVKVVGDHYVISDHPA